MILKNQKRPSSVEDAINYFDLMASYLDELRAIQNEVRKQIRYVIIISKTINSLLLYFSGVINLVIFRNDVNSNIQKASNSTYIGIAILVVVLLVSPIIIFLVRNATNTIQVGRSIEPITF